MTRRLAFWMLIAIALVALAGFVATIQIQRALHREQDRRIELCHAIRLPHCER